MSKKTSEFIDKSGREVKPGDTIIYGHALGRCAGLQYGLALAVKKVKEHSWDPDSSTVAHLTVQGVDQDWGDEPKLLKRKGTLQFGDRTLVLNHAQVPEKIRELLASVKIDGLLKCQDCGKVSADVTETTCPYSEEIYNEKVAIVACSNCIHERSMEV
jgi:hypothetical protein